MQLVLYTTQYCQLCEEAENFIYRQLEGHHYQLKLVDISDSDELMARYAIRIPVLGFELDSAAELDWPFDANQLLGFMKNLGED